jgi:hypothetical protein
MDKVHGILDQICSGPVVYAEILIIIACYSYRTVAQRLKCTKWRQARRTPLHLYAAAPFFKTQKGTVWTLGTEAREQSKIPTSLQRPAGTTG